MKVTHPAITKLKPHQIFVFGSNMAGIHGAGAARMAHKHFGAVWGEGEGLRGQSYALPTKDKHIQTMELRQIETGVVELFGVVEYLPNKEFLITEVGCGLAGYNAYQIAPMFREFVHLDNITLPFKFWQVLLREKL